jgi:predicted ATPase
MRAATIVTATYIVHRTRPTSTGSCSITWQGDPLGDADGPRGIGKTRLALAIAGGLTHASRDGVFLIELAPLSQAELVVQAVAQGLGIRIELDREPLRSLVSVLATRQVLLVLDNCEHLVGSCAELVLTLLRGCPSVRILATSREPRGVEGEMLWRLGPLEATAAIQLFVERARAQRPDFDAGTDGAVPEVCRALDYLPGRLAAARWSP